LQSQALKTKTYIDSAPPAPTTEREGNIAMPADDLPELLTTDEVAEVLRCHPNTVFRWAKAGRLPGVKLFGSWRFRVDDIQNFINTGAA
jgi:excisionase family DNA binding protein